MKKLIIGSFSLLFASVITAPAVRAETGMMTEAGTTKNRPATHIEKLRQQTNGRYDRIDSQVERQETRMGDWQQAPTHTEQLQQETETESTYPTQRSTQQAEDYETEAFYLVRSAYRGELKGIPSYNQLVMDYELGEVTAEDLVEAAIKADMVAPEAIENEAYVNAVQLQLDSLSTTRY